LSLPDNYDGTPSECHGFLLQCSLYVSIQKGDPAISLLNEQAMEWATAIWERGQEELGSYERFMSLFRTVFYHPPEGREGGECLLQLQQGAQTTKEYALTFRSMAASSLSSTSVAASNSEEDCSKWSRWELAY
jgi:hypothetical protein